MVAKSARIEVDRRPVPERRYRVIVCGTGGVGTAVLREALRLPWIDVVGVQVYTSAKAGVDAGELLRLPAAGIMTTADPDEIAALDADCVLYCARDFGDWRSNDVLIRLLESGKNVVTSLAYFRTESHKPEVVERLEDACRRGGTSLHATGLNPGYIGERLGVRCSRLDGDAVRSMRHVIHRRLPYFLPSAVRIRSTEVRHRSDDILSPSSRSDHRRWGERCCGPKGARIARGNPTWSAIKCKMSQWPESRKPLSAHPSPTSR